MSDWYSKNIGAADWADAQLQQLQEKFAALYINPDEAAVFVRYQTVAHLHCTLVLYFSPAAAELAKTLAAQVCAQPAKAGLSLLLGDERVWSRWFAV